MKIVMLGQKGVPAVFGGIERHVEALASRLADSGHEVLVYCRKWYLEVEPRNEKREPSAVNPAPSHAVLNPAGRISMTPIHPRNKLRGILGKCGIKCVVVPTIRTKHLDAIVHTFLATLHALRENPDIYHYHGVGPALLAWIPRLLRPRARVITTFHCLDRKHGKWGLVARLALRLGEWSACRFANTTITVSRTLEQYCRDVYETTSTYIPNGISAHKPTDGTLIQRFGLAPNSYVAQIARLVRHKGVHLTIAAWNQLRRAHPELVKDKKLVIVGDGAFTDDYVAELKLLARDNTSVVFTGFQSGAMLDELFTNALFLVHPSLSEGLPLAVLEAMSYGKVVVASDIPENMEVIAEHGVAVRAGDVHDLAEKIGELLKAPERLPQVGAGARDFVFQHYHWDNIATEVLRVYEQARVSGRVLNPI